MWPYFILFLVPAYLAYREQAESELPSLSGQTQNQSLGWWIAGITIALMVGLRHEVGGDWNNYERNFFNAAYGGVLDALTGDDPGYRLLEWLAIELDLGIHFVNLCGAFIFASGLVVFCRNLPRPWLALTVAVPYLVIVVGMGYARQGIALGCLMIGLVALNNYRVRAFVAWALLAAMFHKSAVLVLPMAALAASHNRWLTILWVGVVAVSAYFFLLESAVEQLRAGYLEASYQSEGALVRLTMNAIPALIFLAKYKEFSQSYVNGRLWGAMALMAILLLGAFFVVESSTAVDRIALYLLPLQLVVFAAAPVALKQSAEATAQRTGGAFRNVSTYTTLYYGFALVVWLVFATHSYAWVPYQFYPIAYVFS